MPTPAFQTRKKSKYRLVTGLPQNSGTTLSLKLVVITGVFHSHLSNYKEAIFPAYEKQERTTYTEVPTATGNFGSITIQSGGGRDEIYQVILKLQYANTWNLTH